MSNYLVGIDIILTEIRRLKTVDENVVGDRKLN